MTEDTTQTQDNGGDNKQQDSMLDVDKVIKGDDGKGDGDQTKQVVDTSDTEQQKNKDVVDEPGKKADRPEYLPEKFWDTEKGEPRLEAMNKAYTDLEKQFRSGDHKAPEKAADYKLGLSDEQKEVLFGKKDANPHDDEGIKAFTEIAAKHKLSQAAVSEILGAYAEMNGKAQDESGFVIDIAAEKAKLGKNADAILDAQFSFLGSMFKTGQINETELKEAKILFETAAGVSLFQKIREHYGEQGIPTELKASTGDIPSKDELAKMRMDDKYDTDKEYRAKVDGYYDRMYGTQPAMSSR